MANNLSTRRVLLTSLFVDALDVFVNVIIAIVTSSTVMLAEALQGVADLTSVSMLLVGYRRSKKRSNRTHPFGYGKEQYFWALISTFLIIGVTASLSFYFGLQRFLKPDTVHQLVLAYAVLIISVASNGYAFWLSLRKILGSQHIGKLPRTFIDSADVVPRTTLVLDAMGTLAALFGLVALIIYGITGDARFDGVGAMVISVLLVALALILLITTKGLVTGKSAPKSVEKQIENAALEVDEVRSVLDIRTMMLGAGSLLVNIEVHLDDTLSTDDIEKVMDEIKDNIRRSVDGRIHINVEPETPPKPKTK